MSSLNQVSDHIVRELGIGPAPFLETLPNLATVSKGYSFMATVDDPSKLAAHGLSGVKKGDRLDVVNHGINWKIKPLATRNAVTVQVELARFVRQK